MPIANKYSILSASHKAALIADWLNEHKAKNQVTIDLANTSPVTELMIIVSSSSVRHGRSLADGLLELCTKENFEFLHMEGYQSGLWILMDLNDIIVHIFQENIREIYQLENLWRDQTVPA